MTASWCSYLPLYPLKVGHQLGKLCAYLRPPLASARRPSHHQTVGWVPNLQALIDVGVHDLTEKFRANARQSGAEGGYLICQG
jgi:hypothetical protein